MVFSRDLTKRLKAACFTGKTILLLGARQVGKTTLLKSLQKELDVNSVWFNADEGDILHEFSKADTSTRLLQLVGHNKKLVIIDEAQQIPDIGKKLKLLYDTNPHIQIIATGSSAFDLKDKTNEPLTGRKRTFFLYPMSYSEIVQNTSYLEAKRLLNTRLVFGSYPEVINNAGKEKEALLEIAESYLYKDLLMIDGIRKIGHIEKLLLALAFQTGSEANPHELAQIVGNIDPATVEKYLELLEKVFVIFKLPAYSRNLRNEIKKNRKYYFYDNGIRNVLINNFSPPDFRLDKGALWENFIISERIKHLHYNGEKVNSYFWRTHDQAEIDYIEERDGILNTFEFKWQEKKLRIPQSFQKAYPNHTSELIHLENFEPFLGVM